MFGFFVGFILFVCFVFNPFVYVLPASKRFAVAGKVGITCSHEDYRPGFSNYIL